MSSISAISSSTAAYATAAEGVDTSPSRVPQKTLGQDDFLKLLAKQFQVQDPMKPMEDTAFIAQMAQFSSLEQSKALVSDMSALRADQQRTAANSYLGHRVTVDAGKGETASGDVTAVDSSGTTPKIVVGGQTYSLSAVLRVEPRVLTAPTPTPAPVPAPTGGA
ncbi:MAG: flagellar hook capping FlgD N-terminal domain-containing protein [Verrucomicrobiota bacterium]